MTQWIETCAITELPIVEGDRVVMVAFDRLFHVGHLLDYEDSVDRDKAALFHLTAIERGEYFDGCIVSFIQKGLRRKAEPRPLYPIFFHEEVWDCLVKHRPSKEAPLSNYYPQWFPPEGRDWDKVLTQGVRPTYMIEELTRMMAFARAARRNIFAGLSQSTYQPESYQEHLILHAVTGRVLTDKVVKTLNQIQD